jgi:ABC-2 type transport system ATP-binding protein
MSPAVVVEQLSYSYRRGGGARRALDALSFSVEPGEIFGLLGPNGAGKSTVVRILTTILRPQSGRALVQGFDVAAEPLQVRRNIAAVLQESAVETMLPVWDNLLLYGRLHGLSAAETSRHATRVLELLEMQPHRGARAQTLSGGFKRRLQVAKALMVDTAVLFLDEATTGMDPIIKRRIMAAIRQEAEKGRTVLLTTQLLDEAEELCDRMVLMNEGRSIAEGNLADLRALSKKMFRIELAFADNGERGLELLRQLEPRAIEEQDGEIVLTVEGSEDEWIRKMARISESCRLSHLQIRGANLEQIFLELYARSTAAPPS